MSQEEFFATVIQILNHLKIPYMLTGSYASNFYGEPRSTHDIDFVVVLFFLLFLLLKLFFLKEKFGYS